MRVAALLLALPLLAACSTMGRATAPSAVVTETTGGTEIAGRWQGHWTGAGLFFSDRRDNLSVTFVQQGDLGFGRLVMEGTGAAESVPWEVRRAGMSGTEVAAKISDRTVTLRHPLDARLFSADMRLSEDGRQMVGVVKGSWPPVGLVLARASGETPAPVREPQSATIAPPASQPVTAEPAPPVVAVAPEARPATKEDPSPARPKQEDLTSVAALMAIHFDFDRADLRAETKDTLQGHATWLKSNADVAVLIEGHCDEKGTVEYNIALGDRRAKSVREYLISYGIAPDRIATISYGKERKACVADTPDCHALNRRAEFRVKLP